jgi:hypothetical protein
LAELFQLENVSAFGYTAEVKQLKLVVQCLPDNADRVIDAASEAGAGIIGAYRRCAHITHGQGTFFGEEGSNPAVGASGRQEAVSEARVEMILPEDRANAVERAIRKVHSYEEPALDFFTLRGRKEQPAGRIGTLPRPMPLQEFAVLADQTLAVRSWTWGDPSRMIKRVGVVGGAADTDWMDAQRVGADLLLTGEVKQHIAVEATESGMTMIAAGHFQTENPGCTQLRDRMEKAIPEIQWLMFTPVPGLSGRPF